MRKRHAKLQGLSQRDSPWTHVSGLSLSQAKAQGLKVLLNSSWLLLKPSLMGEQPTGLFKNNLRALRLRPEYDGFHLSAVTGYPTDPICSTGAGAKPRGPHANKNARGLCTHGYLPDLQEALWGNEGAAGCKTVAICCQAKSVGTDQSHYMSVNAILVPKSLRNKSVSEQKYNL